MKKNPSLPLLALMFLVVPSASHSAPNTEIKFMDVARNASGSVRHMNQYEADKYCRSQGSRLPTARELAFHAQGLGARGIVDYLDWPIQGSNSDGKPDTFYYHSDGYRPPAGDIKDDFFWWSSSVFPGDSDRVYVFNAGDGHLSTKNPNTNTAYSAVWCVLSSNVESPPAVPLKGVVPDLTDIVRRNDKGCPGYAAGNTDVCYMFLGYADSYCRNQGMKLPTARELALYAQSLGAQGISETPKDRYRLVNGSDPDGKPDHFYFESFGYRATDDFGKYTFWSSSVLRGDRDSIYVFAGDFGYLHDRYRNSLFNATRCVHLKGTAPPAPPLKGEAPHLTEIAKDQNGFTKEMYRYEDADSHCRNHRMRLPTARELALYAQSLGAQGISETPKDDYRLVKGLDSEGKPDYFYYSAVGYNRPIGDLGNNPFWYLSTLPETSSLADIVVFYGDTGYFGFSYDPQHGPFRAPAAGCMRLR